MAKKKTLSILFIGNSHTYFNDMPLMVKRRAEDEEFECRVTMIAHPGWFLAQHAEEPDVRFNILYGNYDYVVFWGTGYESKTVRRMEKTPKEIVPFSFWC